MLIASSGYDCIITRDRNSFCFSFSGASTKTGLGIPIQWHSSDLSILQTHPLVSGKPKTRPHTGWDPATALTTAYKFPASCNPSDPFDDLASPECVPPGWRSYWHPRTQEWIYYLNISEEVDAIPARYYSPAICPKRYTAAYTRPVFVHPLARRGVGPAEELGETAVFCCPM